MTTPDKGGKDNEMKNFDWSAFEAGKLVYNARTEEDAKAFLAECEKRGLKWGTKDGPTIDHWREYRDETCYSFRFFDAMILGYGGRGFYESRGKVVFSEPWKRESVVEVLRNARKELGSVECGACYVFFGEDGMRCPADRGCEDAWGKLADIVEAELEEAKQARCCAYIDELASIGRLPKRNQGEPLEKYLNRTHVVLPRWEDGSTVSEGDSYGDTTVAHIAVYSDGDWCINMADDSQVEGTLTQTVERIEPDTQERIDDDATMPPTTYCPLYGIDLDDDPDREKATTAMISHLLERQRKLDAKVGEQRG